MPSSEILTPFSSDHYNFEKMDIIDFILKWIRNLTHRYSKDSVIGFPKRKKKVLPLLHSKEATFNSKEKAHLPTSFPSYSILT